MNHQQHRIQIYATVHINNIIDIIILLLSAINLVLHLVLNCDCNRKRQQRYQFMVSFCIQYIHLGLFIKHRGELGYIVGSP